MKTQELRGFLSIENIENGSHIKKVKIITRLFENKHFVILKYGRNVIDAKDVFNKLNCRYNLGETWFISFNTPPSTESTASQNQDVYSLSFRLFNWINYRNMLFEPGIDRIFKEECLKNRYGFIIIPVYTLSSVQDGDHCRRQGNSTASESCSVELHFKTPCSSKMNAMNQALKSNLCRLIFNKEKID